MCKFSSKSGGVPFQPLGDLTWNDPTDRHHAVGPGFVEGSLRRSSPAR